MAMTEPQVVALELETVDKTVPTLFEREDTFFSEIEKAADAQVVSNRDMRIPQEIRPGGNFGYYSPAGGDLGRGDAQTYDKAIISVVHMKHGIEWHTLTKWATNDRRKAIQDAVQTLVSKGMAEFRRQCDSQCMTSGDGAVGTITSTATTAGRDTYTCTTDGYGTKLMRFGQYLAVYPANFSAPKVITPVAPDTLDGVACKVSGIDYQAKTVTLNGATTTPAAGDRLVVNGLSGANPVGLLGVPYHHNDASTGTWLGYNRANFPEVRASSVDANGVGLALTFARLAVNRVGDRQGRMHGFKLGAWCHPCQAHAYEELAQLVQVIQRSGGSEETANLYFNDNMRLAGVPVRQHFSWDKKRIDMIVNSVWKRAEMKAAGFYTEPDGRKMFEVRGASGGVAASNIFYLCSSWNIYMTNPQAGVYIKNLAVPTGY